MGVVSSLGNSTKTFFENITNGKSGISPITSFDTTNHPVKIAGEIKINLDEYFDSKELNRLDRFSAFALLAAKEAVEENIVNDALKSKVGVIIGSGIGGLHTMEEQYSRAPKKSKKSKSLFLYPQ